VDYPVYQISISDDPNDESGMGYMSIVDKPAIEMDFLVFSKDLKYEIDDEKRVITGAAIIADKPIYRELDGEKCYTVFSAQVIDKIVKKWGVKQNYSLVNTHHSAPVEGMHLFESYLINKERGMNPPNEFKGVADGSWFVSYYITSDDLWKKIKAGEFMGFSIEINAKVEKEEQLQELDEMLKEFIATCTNSIY